MNQAMRPRTTDLVVLALVITLLSYSVLLGSRGLIEFVAGKEKLLEGLGALCYLMASVLSFVVRSMTDGDGRQATRNRRALLLLGIVFFVAAGEEASWGQHFLGFKTPDAIAERNTQGELTLHNLEVFDSYTLEENRKQGVRALLSANRLADYFMLGLFVVVPIAFQASARTRSYVRAVGAPVMPLAFALPLLLNIALTIVSEVFLVRGSFMRVATSETREFNYAALCCLGMWYQLRQAKTSAELGLSGEGGHDSESPS